MNSNHLLYAKHFAKKKIDNTRSDQLRKNHVSLPMLVFHIGLRMFNLSGLVLARFADV